MSKKNATCSLPFTQMFVQSSGKVSPCSYLQRYRIVGDVKDESLQEIWNGQEYEDFRQRHLKGQCPECHEHQEKFGCHLKSRPYAGQIQSSHTSKAPIKLDFMVDSYCNIQCIMCTNIYEERGGFDKDDFWKNQDEIFESVKEIEIIGGEPLISKNFYKLVNRVLDINPNCLWKLTTNGQYNFTKAIRDKLSAMTFINIGYSIDSLDEDVFKRIRIGGIFQKVLENLDHFIDFRNATPREKAFQLDCNVVIQQLNAWEPSHFVDFAREKGINLHLIFLKYPDEHSLIKCPLSFQEELLSHYLEEAKKKKSSALFELSCQMLKELPANSKLKFLNQVTELQQMAWEK